MDKFTIVQWNIRGAAAIPWKKGYKIEPWIVNEILKDLPMCIVLNEFVVSKGWDYLQSELEKNEYTWFITAFTGGNGILIAIKKDIGLNFEGVCNYKPEYILNNEILLKPDVPADVPDFYEIRLKYEEKLHSIIGVRIRKDLTNKKPNYTQNQFALLDDYLSSLTHNVIVIGDFNAFWANKWKTNENHTLPKTSKKYTIHTPYYNKNDGYSFVDEKGVLLQLDHLITNIETNKIDVSYSWGFVNSGNGYQNLSKCDYKNILGIPDHAILKAKIPFTKTYKETYLEPDEYPLDKEIHPYAYECPKCNRIIANDENYSVPDMCNECNNQ